MCTKHSEVSQIVSIMLFGASNRIMLPGDSTSTEEIHSANLWMKKASLEEHGAGNRAVSRLSSLIER